MAGFLGWGMGLLCFALGIEIGLGRAGWFGGCGK